MILYKYTNCSINEHYLVLLSIFFIVMIKLCTSTFELAFVLRKSNFVLSFLPSLSEQSPLSIPIGLAWSTPSACPDWIL